MELRSISSTIATDSRIVLTIPDALHVSGGSSAHHQEHETVHTASGIVKTILLSAAIVEKMELRSISSTIAADSSIVLTIPDAVCTVSWS